MKTIAARLEIKEWDVNATDCTMLNDRISYSLRSHRRVGCVRHNYDYTAY